MTLREMQEKRGQLVTQAREALNEIKKNTDPARAAELEARHDSVMADFDKVEKDIEREQRMSAAEDRIARAAEEERKAKRPTGGDTEQRGRAEGDKPEYRSVFYKFLASGASLDALDAEERNVLREGVQDIEKRIQTAGSNSAGGYTVPVELQNMLVRAMKAWGPMYDGNIVSELNTTSGNALPIPTTDDTANTGVAGTEGVALTDDGSADAAFGQKQLEAYDYNTKFVKFSWQLAQDSIFSVEALLGDLLGERLGRLANAQLTTGTGTNAPNGIVTASTLGKTAASATAIASDELIDLLHSVDPAYRQSPKVGWMFNDKTLAAIRKLKDGQGNYLWQMGDITKGQPAALLDHKYNINQAVADIATGAKAVIFGDLGKFWVRKVGSPVIGVLRERFWPDLGIAGLIRFDGELLDAAAVKHLKLA
ncbi:MULTISPECIES: phage major capsid protein [unclassified Mesorhizobium]|uniref:phage major capsid protein n=1 Tax=unclassified Mesorhizobium TaxID=325217 RepID=UPI000F75DD6F|nr:MULTISPECIES: phage major capsid protein [unclassified Mesorhizobium]AZO54853.1 phage major capsid protein [Mesorhizobium sp. M8A.F.Ca.ET.057.01.1.1]RWE44164.1 MAG: phage major capsid protein [Mesorhizobium sp.]